MPGWIKISIDETCHVVWKTQSHGTQRTMHAIGDGPIGNRVTQDMAEKRFTSAKCVTPWLPVLFAERTDLLGAKSFNCVTAVGRALWRGWFYWP